MKRLIIVLFVSLFSFTAMAQLYAFSLNGKVQLKRNGKWEYVFVGDELRKTDFIQTEKYGYIVILDSGSGKKYSFQAPEARQINELVSSQGQKSPSLAKEVIQGLYNMLMGRDKYVGKGNNTGGVLYRDMDDDFVVASILKSQQKSSYLIDFEILDEASMLPVTQVYEGQRIIFQINNHTDMPLYVNFIDEEPSGMQNAIYKESDSISYQDLYIPALSSVRLVSYAIKFSPANTTDNLMLVAYQNPFDLEHVLELLSENINQIKNNNAEKQIGIYHMSVPIISKQ